MSKRSPMDGDIKCALSTTCAHFFFGGGQRVSRGAHTTQHSTRNIEHYTFLTAHLSKQQSRCELSSYPLSKMCQTASSEQPWLSPFFFFFLFLHVNKTRRALSAALFKRTCRKKVKQNVYSRFQEQNQQRVSCGERSVWMANSSGSVAAPPPPSLIWERSGAAASLKTVLRARGGSQSGDGAHPPLPPVSLSSLSHPSLIHPLFWSFQFHYSIQTLPFCHTLTFFLLFFFFHRYLPGSSFLFRFSCSPCFI